VFHPKQSAAIAQTGQAVEALAKSGTPDYRPSPNPPIKNKTDVDNPTPNRYGISGYLGDPSARRIYDALVAQ
jgi:hypothetical protein